MDRWEQMTAYGDACRDAFLTWSRERAAALDAAWEALRSAGHWPIVSRARRLRAMAIYEAARDLADDKYRVARTELWDRYTGSSEAWSSGL